MQMVRDLQDEASPTALSDAREPITVVTGFFDIGRERWLKSDSSPSPYSRSTDTYFECFTRLAKLKNPMVIFCEDHHAERIAGIRRDAGLADQTTIVSIPDLFALPHVAALEREYAARMTPELRSWVSQPACPEYNEPKYNVIMALKPAFVQDAIAREAVHTSQAAWIDFGFCRDDSRFDPAVPWAYQFGPKISLFNLANLFVPRTLKRLVRTGKVVFMGTNIVGPTTAWAAFKDEIEASVQELLRMNLADDDQTLLYLAWTRHRDRYTTRHIDPKDWFVIFRRFNSLSPTPS